MQLKRVMAYNSNEQISFDNFPDADEFSQRDKKRQENLLKKIFEEIREADRNERTSAVYYFLSSEVGYREKVIDFLKEKKYKAKMIGNDGASFRMLIEW